MPQEREFICVTCPVGCALTALVEGDELLEVNGQACRRGVDFVHRELTDPRRTLTTTVRVRDGALPLVPVRSAEPLPKHLVLPVALALRGVCLEAPITEHQVALADALGTGIDIVTTRDLERTPQKPMTPNAGKQA